MRTGIEHLLWTMRLVKKHVKETRQTCAIGQRLIPHTHKMLQ
jgi:hypothetical protein